MEITVKNMVMRTKTYWGCSYVERHKFPPTKVIIGYEDRQIFIFLSNSSSPHWKLHYTTQIKIFDNKEECINAYNTMVYNEAEEITRQIDNLKDEFESITKDFINTDFLMEKLKRE